jgi:hypothetical protein
MGKSLDARASFMVAILFSSLATTVKSKIFRERQDRRSIADWRAAIARAETLPHSQLAKDPKIQTRCSL